jgi:hypothetical protein
MAEAYRYRSEALGLAGAPERPMVTDAELERLVGELERGWAAQATAQAQARSPGDLAERRDAPNAGRAEHGPARPRGR